MFDKKTIALLLGIGGLVAVFYFLTKITDLKSFITLPFDTANQTATGSSGLESTASGTAGSGKAGFSDLLETPVPTL